MKINCEEIWKPIQGFPTYEISSYGRCRSGGSRILKPRRGGYKRRYLRYNLFNDRVGIDRYAHRLVAETFIGPSDLENCQVDHIDNIKTNNHIENLRWLSPAKNSAHKIICGTSGKGETNSCAKLSDADADYIVSNYCAYSSSELAELFKISRSSVNGIASGRIRQKPEHAELYALNKQEAQIRINASRDKYNASRKKIK